MNVKEWTLKEYVENWKRLGPLLERMRAEEFHKKDLAQTLMSLSDASEAALRLYPAKPTSGMIEMQKYFIRSREKK
jgi:hypothetical protein